MLDLYMQLADDLNAKFSAADSAVCCTWVRPMEHERLALDFHLHTAGVTRGVTKTLYKRDIPHVPTDDELARETLQIYGIDVIMHAMDYRGAPISVGRREHQQQKQQEYDTLIAHLVCEVLHELEAASGDHSSRFD